MNFMYEFYVPTVNSVEKESSSIIRYSVRSFWEFGARSKDHVGYSTTTTCDRCSRSFFCNNGTACHELINHYSR